VEWYPQGWAAADDVCRRSVRLATHGVAGHPGPQSVQQKAEAVCGMVVEAGATRGAAVGAAWGRNPGGTAGAGREATGGSNPRGTSGAGWQGATVPTVVSRVPTVETVEPDS
jgi:hypothetical protein